MIGVPKQRSALPERATSVDRILFWDVAERASKLSQEPSIERAPEITCPREPIFEIANLFKAMLIGAFSPRFSLLAP